jgi:hypothetical protein
MIDWTKDLEWKVDGNDWKPADLVCSNKCSDQTSHIVSALDSNRPTPIYMLVDNLGKSIQGMFTNKFTEYNDLIIRNKPNTYGFRITYTNGNYHHKKISGENEKEAFKELLDSIILEKVDYITRLGQKTASESNDSKPAKVIVPENTFSFKVAI